MRTILSLFVVLLFVVSCTPDGGDIARDFVEGLGDVIDDFEENCADCNGDDFEDDEEEGIDCSDPVFSTVKPLPEGSNPLVWESLDNQHWSCGGIDYVFRLDGTSTSRRKGDFSDHLSAWEACKSETRRPPYGAGRWVITEDNRFCERFDLYPGRVSCYTISLSPELNDIFILSGGGISDLRKFILLYETSDGSSERDTCFTREGAIE